MTRRESLLLLTAGCASAQANLIYQKRGRYSEGIRTALSTGPALDLIAAMADSTEPYQQLPAQFRARFHLPDPRPPHLTIREIQPNVYFYWLESLKEEEQRWQAGRTNLFEWPTSTVIRSLTGKGRPLGLADLAAVVRLGSATPALEETVVPVALYHTQSPPATTAYRFVFRPSERMRLQFQLGGERQVFPRVMGGQPHSVTWDCRSRAEGWHKLEISGYALDNNKQVGATVQFYHTRRL